MDKFQIRDQILRYLYNKEERGDYTETDWDELSNKLGIGKKSIERQVHRLSDGDFLEEGGSQTCTITNKGSDFVEGHNPFNPLDEYKRQLVEVVGSNHVNIIIAGTSADGASQVSGLDAALALQLFQDIIHASDGTPQQKQTLTSYILDSVKQHGPASVLQWLVDHLSSAAGL